MNKRMLYVSIFFFLMVLISGCSRSSPTSTAKSFYNALNAGSYEKAMLLVSKNAVNLFGIDKLQMAFKSYADDFKNKGGIQSMEFGKETILGDKAVVEYHMKLGDGTNLDGSLKLVKEDNQWKIDVGK